MLVRYFPRLSELSAVKKQNGSFLASVFQSA